MRPIVIQTELCGDLSVGRSVSVTIVSPATTAVPIEMQFELLGRVQGTM